MRVLITGAGGFAGRHLCALFVSDGLGVTGLGRSDLPPEELPPGLERYLCCDLTDARQAAAAISSIHPDLVFHLAGQASVGSAWKDPGATIKANLDTTIHLLEALRRHAPAARVMIACSGEVYGAHADLPVTEEHPLRPRNPYAVSKAAADHAAALYHEAHGMHVVRMRAFNHAGPGQSDSHVVSKLARQIVEGEVRAGEGAAVEIVTGGLDVSRDFTDVRDVVRAYRAGLEHGEPGAYNVCSDRSTSIRSILQGLSDHAEVEVVQRTDPAQLREREVHEIRGSHEKLTRAVGWSPEIPLERTLADTLDWWRARLGAALGDPAAAAYSAP
jgi:GDP-4-dehydro-6-deoxy-D-mannose reductase